MSSRDAPSARLPTPAFWRGARAFVPLIPGVLPFSMVAGIAAVQAGFTPAQAIAFSLIGYAGSAQLIASQMVAGHAPAALIVLSTLVVNLRFLMYSASLLPLLAGVRLPARWPLAYLLTDQAYALTVAAREREPDPARFYLGSAVPMWLTWQAGTALGALLGARIPAGWPLDFAVPLSFVALLVPALKTRPQLLTAAVSALVAVAAHALPFRGNLIVGAACGLAAGVLAQGRTAQGRAARREAE